ncbi:MAG TPA: hypothetical protein VJB05_02130 [archaeon]|nr:hypothetical protein [archaeon]
MERKPKKKAGLKREILEVIIAFLIAWFAYQGLSIVMGTSLPIVSVVSDSMYHKNHFDYWWVGNSQYYDQYGIDKNTFKTFKDVNGLSRGDLLLIEKPANLKTGDILIYQCSAAWSCSYARSGELIIIHRLIGIDSSGKYIVKGDNNAIADNPVPKEYVLGKAVFAVPILGYPRLLLHLFGI